jgi:hypothetical protein
LSIFIVDAINNGHGNYFMSLVGEYYWVGEYIYSLSENIGEYSKRKVG